MNKHALRRADEETFYAVGVDLGGTKISAAVIDRGGQILQQHVMPTLAGQADVMPRVAEAVETVWSRFAAESGGARIRGIGIGTAGQVEWETGTIRYASDLIPGYTGTRVKSLLEERFGVPVYVDNDVNALALTEKYLGAGRNAKTFVCLALGTGVGGAVMTGGRIMHGAWGSAGEIGHLSVDYKGRPCICGNVGCLEQYASGTSIANLMNERLQAAGLAGTRAPLSAKETADLWLAGDPLAGDAMNEAIAALGSAVASLIHLFNPEAVVIGGGVAACGEPLFRRLREEVRRRAMPSMFAGVMIEPACGGGMSGAIGAALQVWEYAHE